MRAYRPDAAINSAWVPISSILPSCSTTTRSAYGNAARRCEHTMMVTRSSGGASGPNACFSDATMRSSVETSTAENGSVSEAHDLVFTSNRGENTVGILSPSREETVGKVKVGVGPNGLAYGADHRLLLAANVGDPSRRGSFTVSLLDVSTRAVIANIPVPGRTRWTVFDAESGRFYVNVADPPQIVVVDSADPTRVVDAIPMPADGAPGVGFEPTA